MKFHTNPIQNGDQVCKQYKITTFTPFWPKKYVYTLFSSIFRAGDSYHAYMSKQIVVVKYTGWVNWAAPIIIKSHCTIDVTSFPFDTQMCKLKFGPWQYNGKDVVLKGEGTTIQFFSYRYMLPLYISCRLFFSSSLLLYALNSAADKYVPYMEKKVNVIYYNGLVNWAAPVIMKSHCKIDVTNFPFDEQYCKLKFGPWQYSGNETVLFGTGMSPQNRCNQFPFWWTVL